MAKSGPYQKPISISHELQKENKMSNTREKEDFDDEIN